MSNKTPAMILQELAIKMGRLAPEYTIIHQVQGKHENEFEYQVQVLEISATGKGRSKKEAKQETAKNALAILHERNVYKSDEGLPETDPYEDQELKQVHNYIGVLADTCIFYNIPTPEYIEISAEGPSHAMEFAYECRIGDSITTRTTSTTKKNAKQIVAKDMLERIHDIIPKILVDQEEALANLNRLQMEAVDYYKDLSIIPKFNMGLQICDYNENLRAVMKEKGLLYEDIEIYFEKPWTDFKLSMLLEKLELNHSYEDVTVESEELSTVILHLTADFPLSSMGQAKTAKVAETSAMEQMFEILLHLLKSRLISAESTDVIDEKIMREMILNTTDSFNDVRQMESKKTPLKTPKKSDKKHEFDSLNGDELLRKHAELVDEETVLVKEIEALSAEGFSGGLKPEMQALHDYNDMKDLAQIVLGYLADAEHTTLLELHERFQLPTE